MVYYGPRNMFYVSLFKLERHPSPVLTQPRGAQLNFGIIWNLALTATQPAPHIWKPNWDFTIHKQTNKHHKEWEKQRKLSDNLKLRRFDLSDFTPNPNSSLSLGFQNALVFGSQNPKISIPNCEILGFWSVPRKIFFFPKKRWIFLKKSMITSKIPLITH